MDMDWKFSVFVFILGIPGNFNFYHSLGKFSRRQTDVIFSYFYQKIGILHFIQNNGDNLHEMSNPALETICMKCEIPFSGKFMQTETICRKSQIPFSWKYKKRNTSKCRLLKILPRVLSVVYIF